MQNYDIIIDLIKQEKYVESERLLIELNKENPRDGYINYLLGFVNFVYNNEKRDPEKAKRYFIQSIESKNPTPDSYYKLSLIEDNIKHSIRILKKGLEKFPNNNSLLERLIFLLEDDDKIAMYESIKTKLDSDLIKEVMTSTYIKKNKYEQSVEILESYAANNRIKELFSKFLKGICLFNVGHISKSKKIFQSLIDEDIDHSLGYMHYLGGISSLISNEELDKAQELFFEIPYEYEDIWIDESELGNFDFDFEKFFLNSINIIIKSISNKEVKAKARCIRGIYFYLNEELTRKQVKQDLEFSYKHLSNKEHPSYYLFQISLEEKNHFRAYEYSIEYLGCLNMEKLETNILDFGFVGEVQDAILEFIVNHILSYNDRYVVLYGIFSPLINRYYKDKNYKKVVELSNWMGEYYLQKADLEFEIAFSLSEIGEKEKSKKLYQKIISRNPNNSSAINNLGVIFENERNYKEAEILFKKAYDLNPDETIYQNNLKRVLEYFEAALAFKEEDIQVKKHLLALRERRDFSGNIDVERINLPDIWEVSKEFAKTALIKLKNKKYIIDRNDKIFVNPELESSLESVSSEVEKQDELIKLSNSMNLSSLNEIGYDDDLIISVGKVNSPELRIMLKRDLKEAAIANLCKSFKISMVICGSIIETILYDKITSSGIFKYKMENGKNISVNRMDLDNLLFIARNENMIDEQLYFLAHAIRGFRNLIHPSVEQRKKATKVTEHNARIVWDITKKLLLEI